MVEFCLTTAEFSEEDRQFAREMVSATEPKLNPKQLATKFHRSEVMPIHKSATAGSGH